MYKVQLSHDAADFLRSQTKKVMRQITKKLDSLTTNPRPHGCKKLKGVQDLYRIRSGDYRIVYQIKDKIVTVSVLRIANRKDAYKGIT